MTSARDEVGGEVGMAFVRVVSHDPRGGQSSPPRGPAHDRLLGATPDPVPDRPCGRKDNERVAACKLPRRCQGLVGANYRAVTPGCRSRRPRFPVAAPGFRGSAHGLDRSAPGFRRSALGLEASAQGLGGSALGLGRSAQGLEGSAPGFGCPAQGLEHSARGFRHPAQGFLARCWRLGRGRRRLTLRGRDGR